MKTELRPRPDNSGLVELWYNGVLVGTLEGAEGRPGMKLVSPHNIQPQFQPGETLKGLDVELVAVQSHG